MWMILVAALLAALMLVQSVGVEAAVGLVVVTIGGVAGWRAYRKRRPAAGPKPEEIYCLRCGASMPLSARSCKECGSAAWSVRQ